MISRRLAALALSLLVFSGCQEDPSVVSVEVTASVQALAFLAAGGTASSQAGIDGTGGKGGDFSVTANGLISLGSASFVPAAPATPTPPTAFATTPPSPVAPVTSSGSILLTGSLTTTPVASVLIKSDNGDIVVSGTLQSGDTGAAQTNITLQADNGTVYITGAVRTAGDDGIENGRAGGNLTIRAARVVITGSIDTHGVKNSTVAGVNGGKGGDVDINTAAPAGLGPILFTAGSIVTSGGDCVDTNNTVSIRGGSAGFVHLNSAAPVNSVHVFAPITANGGAVTGNGTTPQGGDGGEISIQARLDADIVTTLSSLGGAAVGNGQDAVGGQGGTLNIDGSATARIYGSLMLGGGSAFATTTGGTVTGGKGGSVLVGQAARVNSVEFGQGAFSMSGGTGQRSGGVGGGDGGAVTVESFDGDITIGSSFSVAGGAAAGSGNSGGGAAGTISIITDARAAGNLSNHFLSIPSLASELHAGGGAALGTGTGGSGGTVLLRCGGDLTCGARIIASGGSSVNGVGGPTLAQAAVPGADPASSVVLHVSSVNHGSDTGNLTVTGEIDARGGATTSGGTGGGAKSISLVVASGVGSILSSATLNASGASDLVGNAGAAGNLVFGAVSGSIDLSGTLTVSGGTSPATATASGNVTVAAGGALSSSAVINAVGGAATEPAGTKPGLAGGIVRFASTGLFGGISLLPGTVITADGGSANASAPGTFGGGGGIIRFECDGRPISLSGSLLARGGATSPSGTGGLGGLVLAASDFNGTLLAGDITLNADGGIDVSGGSGFVGGPARSTFAGGTAVTDPPLTLAVVFDANNSLGTSGGGAVPGKTINLGSITAAGGSGAPVGVGGDVFFNGLNAAGTAVTLTDGGTQNRTGFVAGDFFPN